MFDSGCEKRCVWSTSDACVCVFVRIERGVERFGTGALADRGTWTVGTRGSRHGWCVGLRLQVYCGRLLRA